MVKNISILKQEWHNLLFLHWPIPTYLINDKIPNQLELDTFNDYAWIGIIPFQMRKLRPSCTFSIPPISNFTEINLRTYVKDKYNRKGVWFFSLDTQNPFGNWIAQTIFHLNYRYAITDFKSEADGQCSCKFSIPSTDTAEQIYTWKNTDDTLIPSKNPDSLEFFLTERYRLFSYNKRKKLLLTGTLHHQPYVLNRPILYKYSTELFFSNKIKLLHTHPYSVLACKKAEVNVFSLETIR